MRLCVVQLAPGHGSSTTIAGAIALPGYETSCAVEGWSVQLNVLLPEAVEAAVKVHFQRRVPLRHARLRVQTFTLIDQGTGFAIAAADAATEVELAADVLTKFAPTAGVVGSQLAGPPAMLGPRRLRAKSSRSSSTAMDAAADVELAAEVLTRVAQTAESPLDTAGGAPVRGYRCSVGLPGVRSKEGRALASSRGAP